ncbi:hypothetical protein MBLNU459_g6130t1 [Dothideomycetes sp. NU459]
MLVSLTVGKVDAGVAVLLTEDKRLIEFPSILLPPDITTGSIVDINVSRNFHSEERASQQFASLQSEIHSTFGLNSPSAPLLRCRNATQTSVVLEWDPINLATAELRSLSLYRNGSKAGNIPRDKLSTKISGLAVDTEYTYHLVLRTSAGTYTSEKLAVRTQKMTDLTGITITPGVMPAQLRDSLAETVERIGAKLIDTVRIDTTHFVCTEGRGQAWEKALEMNVPVVVPDWIKGCEREGRIVGVRGYYLNADPKLRQVGPGVQSAPSQTSLPVRDQPQLQQPPPQQERRPSQQNQQLRVEPPLPSPRIEHTPPTPEQARRPDSLANGTEEPPTPPPKMDSPAPEPAATEPEIAPTSEETRVSATDVEPQPPVEDASPAAEPPETMAEQSAETTEEEEMAEPKNSLKAIGIPHEPQTSTSAPVNEEGFDEVDL